MISKTNKGKNLGIEFGKEFGKSSKIVLESVIIQAPEITENSVIAIVAYKLAME
jgi:hypothetical protein